LISASLPLSFPSLLSTLSLSLVSLSLSRLDYARVEEQKRRKRKKKEEENNKEQEGRTGHGNWREKPVFVEKYMIFIFFLIIKYLS
jgi:hypothetical protein